MNKQLIKPIRIDVKLWKFLSSEKLNNSDKNLCNTLKRLLKFKDEIKK